MVIDQAYKILLKPILFKMDPEKVHNSFTKRGILLSKYKITRRLISSIFNYENKLLETTVAGINFKNPIGLAAGFDKNAKLYNILPDIGFGFAELGSVTGMKCLGNPKPRLFRLPKEKSIIVNYGLCNEGSEEILNNLKNKKFRIPIGISIAKANDPELNIQGGIKDYLKAYRNLHQVGSYTTINVSCPNTTDGLTFCQPNNLQLLLRIINKEKHLKPIFLKLNPDLQKSEKKEVINLIEKYSWISGVIISNLRKDRTGIKNKQELDRISSKGGLSGLLVKEKSNNMIKLFHRNSDKIIIGCGGVFNGKDAYKKLELGSSLVQLVTGLIYEGPGVISRINKELVEIMQEKGIKSINEITQR